LTLNGSLCKFVATVLLPFILLMPILPNVAIAQALAQSSGQSIPAPGEDLASACAQGSADAQRDTSGMWFFAGCLGIIGILLAYLVEPSPPVSSIFNKSPQYVAMYTDCYKSAGKSAQGRKALVGCAVVAAIEVVLYVAYILIIIAALEEDEDSW
jgi:hypothetical protein